VRSIFASFALLTALISCNKNNITQGAFKINVPCYQCNPGETLLLSVNNDDTFIGDSITWYVNGVKQKSTGRFLELTTDNDEKRYCIFARYCNNNTSVNFMFRSRKAAG